jgi:dTDP-4-amino-4,6-dideoxygalactose transaminase
LQIISKVAIALAGSNFEILGLTNEQHFNAVQIDLSKGPVPHSWMAIPISYKGTNLTLEQVHSALNSLGVATRPVLAGNFVNQPAGKHEMISIFRNLENSNEIYAKSFMIGNHHNIGDEQLAHLLDALMSIIRLDEP